jgi:hypothetical protein
VIILEMANPVCSETLEHFQHTRWLNPRSQNCTFLN